VQSPVDCEAVYFVGAEAHDFQLKRVMRKRRLDALGWKRLSPRKRDEDSATREKKQR